MKNKIFKSLTVCSVLLASHLSLATVITDDVLDPSSGLIGTFDPTAPVGDGAWTANTFGNPGSKSFQWLYWNDTGSEFTLGDLLSLSFDTNKPVESPNNDFYISIYTIADGTNDGASWYGQRLAFDPFYASSVNGPANQWNTWSTSGSENMLSVYDHGIDGGYSAPSLTDLLDGTYTDDDIYSFANVNYNSEKIRGISISTGSAWGNTYQGSIDNVNLDFGNAGSLSFDLEPTSVPEPSTLAIFALAMIGFASRRFKKQS